MLKKAQELKFSHVAECLIELEIKHI